MQITPDKNKVKSLPFFFIIGRPRSGTTLLRTLFDANPEVIIPLECPLIIDLYSKYGKTKIWDKKKLLSFYVDIQNQREFESWTIDKDKLKDDIFACEGETSFNSMCKIIYYNYISFFDKKDIKLLGDKNPVYSLYSFYTKRLIKIFPEAKFIHITRDYRDNILSIQKIDFEAPILPLLAYRWKYSFKQINKVKNKHPELFYTIKYEELVKDPGYHLQNLCDFLKIEYSLEMLEFRKKKDEVLKVHSELIEKYQKNLFAPINTTKINLWKKQMSDRDIKVADMVVGKYAELSGYSRKYKKLNILIYLCILPAIIYGRLWYLLIKYFIDKLPYKTRMRIIKKEPVLAKLYRKLFN